MIGTWKFLRYALILMSAITIVSSIISGVIVGIENGKWEDLARATGGKLLSTDRDISLSVEKLKDIKTNPDKYDIIDTDNLKTRLWGNIGILIIIGFLIFKLLMWLWDAVFHDLNIFSVLIGIVGTIFIMSFLQVGWIMYESKYIAKQGFTDKLTFPEAVPFYGTYNLLTNFRLMGITGHKNLFEGILPEVLVNQTIETTLPETVTIIDY